MLQPPTRVPSVRSDARILLGFKALFYTNSVDGSAVVSNFSRGGAFLVTRARLRVGHTVRLIVMLGNGHRQELTGCVVRSENTGFAICFDESRGEAGRLVHNINTIINTRLAMQAIADLPPVGFGRELEPIAAVA